MLRLKHKGAQATKQRARARCQRYNGRMRTMGVRIGTNRRQFDCANLLRCRGLKRQRV